MRRWRQNCNLRKPRLNQEIRLRATFLRCAAASFFRRASCFASRPTFRWKPPSRVQGLTREPAGQGGLCARSGCLRD